MKLVISRACDTDGTDFGNVDISVAVHLSPVVNVNLSPDPDHQFIARSNDVVSGYRNTVQRRECGRDRTKKSLPEYLQVIAQRTGNKILELNVWFRRKIQPFALPALDQFIGGLYLALLLQCLQVTGIQISGTIGYLSGGGGGAGRAALLLVLLKKLHLLGGLSRGAARNKGA
jgi:hypothetical protein